MKQEEAFYIGYFTKTKGLKGELQLFFEFDDYEALELDVLFADINGKLVPYFVASHKIYPNSTALFYLDDVDHIDKAQPLVKKKVYLPLTKMPERDEDDFQLTDLKGYEVHDETHGELGKIIEVNEYPQQFVATVAHKTREILFPLNDDFIQEIDDEAHILYVDLPEGLLDIYLND
ncbi:MAG: 16S rRNA processing protein RimM [Chitinophagaceae bacterium]|nr:MAG: 16S rRNA processing protein RimM [Chitinophagaceae bacterium]